MRQTTITTHPDRAKIEAAIVEGVPAVQISTRFAVSQSAISRHKRLRMGTVLAQLLDDRPGVTDTLLRLRELADSARKARQLADATGSPSSRSQAQKNELAVLTQLTSRLGIRDVGDLDYARDAQQMSNAVVKFLRDKPEHLEDITSRLLSEGDDWTDYVEGLQAHIKNRRQA